jgi:uncharacterized membrane protein YdbT with pleckstrin-like domain
MPSAVITFFGFAFTVAGLAMPSGQIDSPRPVLLMLGLFLLFVIGPLSVLACWLNRRSSEFAVTTNRVIMKTGFISRRTLELLHHKVDSLSVSQGLLGRLFNFGTLVVTVAVERQTFNLIRDPLAFRKQVQLRVGSPR